MPKEISPQINNRPEVTASYTLPTIDLAGQIHRQTIVDRENGQYLGYVSTILLADRQTISLEFTPKAMEEGLS